VFGNPLLRDLTLINSSGDLLFVGVGLLIIVRLTEIGVPGSSIGMSSPWPRSAD
jgi:hypothetical protein